MCYFRLLLSFLLVGYCGQNTFAQDQRVDVIHSIEQLFDGMRVGDSSLVRSVFLPTATLQTVRPLDTEKSPISSEPIDKFINAIGTPHDEIWDEKIWSYDVKVDGHLAMVWTDYTFYLGKKRSHCGVNVFQLIETPAGWKINQITDTRRQNNCRETPDSLLNQLMDQWHHAAAVADENIFFGTLGLNAIYIGTDATERWTKPVFEKWAIKYFERDTAWAFQPIERQWYYSQDGQVAWFDETLDTWMGVCRGSGVLEKRANGWQLQHYHLAIAVPNEKVKGYLQLLRN